MTRLLSNSPAAAPWGLVAALLLLAGAAAPASAQTPGAALNPPPSLVAQIKRLCLSEAQRDSHMGHNSFPDEQYFRKGYTIRPDGDIRYVDGRGEAYYSLQLVVDGELERTSQKVEVRRDCQVRRAGRSDAYVIFANRKTEILSGVGATNGPDVLKPFSEMSDAERSALKPSEIAARTIDMRIPQNRAIGAEMDRLEARYLDGVKRLCKSRAEKDYGSGTGWRVVGLLGRKDWKHSHNFFVVVRAVDAAGTYAYVCEVWATMPPDQKNWVEGEFTVGRFYRNDRAVIVEGMK